MYPVIKDDLEQVPGMGDAVPPAPDARRVGFPLADMVELGLIWGGIYLAQVPSNRKRIAGLVTLGLIQTFLLFASR